MSPHPDGNCFCFVFEGFYIQIYIPGIKLKERKSFGVLQSKNTSAFIPYLNIFDIPQLVELMEKSYGKHKSGLSKVRK